MDAPKTYKPSVESFYKYIQSSSGLPRENPTASYWQHVPHPLARHRSDSMLEDTDIAIIGSGITGLGVAKGLLEGNSTLRITVLEACDLCSGATGRNGGQLAINAAENYEEMKATVGSEMAGKIVHFTLRNMKCVPDLLRTYNISEADYNDVEKLRLFQDEETSDNAKRGLALLESEHPSLRGLYKVVDSETCVKEHGIHGIVGAFSHAAGTLWPYRMVTRVWNDLMEKYPDRLNIEINTPVTSVSCEPENKTTYPYAVHTSRGIVRASKVAYCVNGYIGHLLPELRGRMFPVKGTMTVQDLSAQAPNRGATNSWAVHYLPRFDKRTGTLADGLQYIAQNARSGYFFIGGENSDPYDMFSSDDTSVASTSREFLQDTLPKLFGQRRTEKSKLISSWSGIMGFTADNMPMVGRLPQSVTKRRGMEEWVAGAYCGYVMPNALLSGESLADLMLGKKLDPSFPEAYLITEKRLQSTLTTYNTKRIMEDLLSAVTEGTSHDIEHKL